MGMRSSKWKRNSYDISTVVSDKDFIYKKNAKTLPNLGQPLEKEKQLEEPEHAKSAKTELANVEIHSEIRDERIPDWVNEKNFKKLLLKTHPNIIDIIDFKAKPAMAAGENYSTFMIRIKLSAKFKDDSLKDFCYMLKVAHDSKEMKDMLQAMNFFATENSVYREVMPELEQMYLKAGEAVKFAAKSHMLDLESENVHYVLLDDLSVDGFKNANRLECLNMEHTLSVLRKMAQFHAGSACRAAKNGLYSSVFSPDVDNEMARAMINQLFMSFKKPFLDNLKHYDNGEKYYDVMDNFFDNIIEMFVRSRKLLTNYFTVLNHGDLWSNNILFKYTDDGKVAETLFVDFQNTNWGSPALDLYYFIISSVQIDIKLSQFDYFIRYYHEHLSGNLKLLGYTLAIPNLRDFHIQMIDFGSMATITAFMTLGVVLLDPTNSAKFENFIGDSEESYNFKNAIYTNERYCKYINEILPWLYNRGFMEIHLNDLDNRIAAADKSVELISQQTENNEELSNTFPEWINNAFFSALACDNCENYQKILKIAVTLSMDDARDDYSSRLFQICIDVELTDHTTRNLCYLLKTRPIDDQSAAAVDRLNKFVMERKAYFEIIPQLEGIYKDQAGIDVAFAPKAYKLNHNKESEVLVLENLRTRGFTYCNPSGGLDMQHTEHVLKKLAELHAASACLLARKGKLPEINTHSRYVHEMTEIRRKMFNESFIKTYLECLKQYQGHEEYINKLEHFFTNFNTYLKESGSNSENNKFNVLNHGDCWTGNILFEGDNIGNAVHTRFEGFQFALIRGSPCYDLYYFLLSSPKLELKLEHFDYFIRYYHEKLKSNLELLKYAQQIPSLEDLHTAMLDNAVWALFTVICVLFENFLDRSDKIILEKIVGVADAGRALKDQLLLNDRYRSQVETILPWLNRRGLLDFTEIRS